MPRICHPFHTTLTAHTHTHTHTAKYICAKKWKKPCLGEKFATCFCARCEKCVSSSQLITGSRTQNSTRAQTFPHTYIIFVRGFVWPTIWGTLTCTLCTHTHTYRIRIFMAKSENVCIRLVCGIGNTKDRKCHMAI